MKQKRRSIQPREQGKFDRVPRTRPATSATKSLPVNQGAKQLQLQLLSLSTASHSPPQRPPGAPTEKQCCFAGECESFLCPTSSLHLHVSSPYPFKSSIEAFSSELTLCTQRTTAPLLNGRLPNPTANLLPKIIQQLFLPNLRAQASSTRDSFPAIQPRSFLPTFRA